MCAAGNFAWCNRQLLMWQAREVFAEVLNNIVVSYRHRPRRLYLILVDPVAADLVETSGVFQRVELPMHERLKVQFLSPYEVAVYRSLA